MYERIRKRFAYRDHFEDTDRYGKKHRANTEIKVYLKTSPVKNFWLKIFGYIFLLSKPTHTQLYWTDGESCWRTELTSLPPDNKGLIVGKGPGYTIQITKVACCEGELIKNCEGNKIEKYAKAFAGKWNIAIFNKLHMISPEPKGYGGPNYTSCTCNTYISWLLKKICKEPISKPKGAFGWDFKPLFPTPKEK